MANKVLSIEIGQSFTRVIEMDYKSKNPKIYNAFSFATPEEMVTDGAVEVGSAFNSILAGKLKERKINTNKVIFVLNSARIASREIEIPNVKENKIKDILIANASDYFPVDLNQYQLIHEIIGRSGEGNSKKIKLSVLAVPDDIIKSYELLAANCDLTLIGLDYIGNAIKQLMVKEIPEDVKVTIKVDATVSILTIMEDEEVKLQRVLNYGINDAIEEIQSSELFGDYLEFEEAMDIARKRTCVLLRFDQGETNYSESDETGMEVDSQKLQMMRRNVTESLETLIGSFSRVLDYYQSRNSEKSIERIYLVGLGADFSGLSKLMTNELNYKVIPLLQFDGISLSKNISLNNSKIAEYFTCIGATVAPLSILSEKKGKRGKEDGDSSDDGGSLSGSVTIFALCVVVSVVMIAYGILSNMALKSENITLQNQVNELAYAHQIAATYNETNRKFEWVSKMDQTAYGPNNELDKFIKELEQKMPSQIKVLSLSATGETVTLSIDVEKKAAVAEVISQLRTFETITVGTVSTITEETQEDSHVVNFTVDCQYTPSAIAGTEVEETTESETNVAESVPVQNAQ